MERNIFADIAAVRPPGGYVPDQEGLYDSGEVEWYRNWECDVDRCRHRDCLTFRDEDVGAMDEYGIHVDPPRGDLFNA